MDVTVRLSSSLSFSKILGKKVSLKIFTDSKALYDSCTHLTVTSEKRRLIALALLREAYEDHEISEIVWIPGSENPADALTNLKMSLALAVLLHQIAINLNPNA